MSKWKCEICGKEFDNFHAQGFDNKIYCPLCYFKKENQELKSQLEEVEFMVGLRQKRNLISKFDKEYDEEDNGKDKQNNKEDNKDDKKNKENEGKE